MGNSEVGHLNLGAGAVVMQDLTRIDLAVERGELAVERGAARRVHRRRAGPPDRAGLRRRRALGLGAPRGADPARRRARRPRPRAARVHRRARHAADVGRRLPGDGRGVDGRRRRRADRLGRRALLRDGPRQALGPGPARLRHARARDAPSTTPTSGAEAARAAYERDETDEFITPVLVGEEARIRPGDSVFAFNFRPDRMREITRALAEPGLRRDRSRRRGDGRALREHDRVRGGLAVPGRVPARAPVDDDVGGDRGARRPPAPRRRDREVPARDVLLQRRRGGAVRGRAARARALAARRADLRLQARDERPRGRRARSSTAGGPTRRRSGSSTSPTPTWSATPA